DATLVRDHRRMHEVERRDTVGRQQQEALGVECVQVSDLPASQAHGFSHDTLPHVSVRSAAESDSHRPGRGAQDQMAPSGCQSWWCDCRGGVSYMVLSRRKQLSRPAEESTRMMSAVKPAVRVAVMIMSCLGALSSAAEAAAFKVDPSRSSLVVEICREGAA